MSSASVNRARPFRTPAMREIPGLHPDSLTGLTAVFDLDGTLVDTAPDLIRALNATLASEGLPEVSRRKVHHLVGHGARALIIKGIAECGVSLTDSRLDSLTDNFIAHYRQDIACESRLYPGALETLHVLRAAGARIAICTNKLTFLALELLDALGIRDLFDGVTGPDRTRARKPSPVHFIAAVEEAGGHPQAAVMFGDSGPDLAAARAANAPVALVDFGYGGDVRALAPDAVVRHFAEIPGLTYEFWLRIRRM